MSCTGVLRRKSLEKPPLTVLERYIISFIPHCIFSHHLIYYLHVVKKGGLELLKSNRI